MSYAQPSHNDGDRKKQMINYPALSKDLNFSDYVTQCQSLIQQRRTDLNTNANDAQKILAANSPYELRPTVQHASKKPYQYGVLFVHGLFDSPLTLRDIANELVQQDMLCRAVLLPGHGTQPADLLDVSYQDWINVVHYGIQSLRKDAEKIVLVGYSTGATLSVYHALKENDIAGMVMISPAMKIKAIVDVVFNWHRLHKWTKRERYWVNQDPEIDYAKYKSIPFNPVFQVSGLLKRIKALYRHHSIDCPIFMALSREDETISSDTAIDFFSDLKHPASELLLYTTGERRYTDTRIQPRLTNQYKELCINHFSHMCLPFAPNNSHYGQHGDYIYASHVARGDIYGAYNHLEQVAFKCLYQYGLTNHLRSTLTYNPDFAYMASSIAQFIRTLP